MTGSENHSSIVECQSLKNYIHGSCKYYYLPLHQKLFLQDRTCELLGVANPGERSRLEVESSIAKASKGHFSHIKVPIDRPDQAWIEFINTEARAHDIKIVLQIFTSLLHDSSYFKFLENLDQSFEREWVVDEWSLEVEQQVFSLGANPESDHLSVVIHRKFEWSGLLKSRLLDHFRGLHIYFGYQLSHESDTLNCQEAHRLVGLLRKRYPALDFYPPKGTDLWDQRALADFDMEPFLRPCFESFSVAPKIKFSVIIPTFNNQNHLRVVIEHLRHQNVGLDAFEVIIVDDGSSDQTQELVLEKVSQWDQPMNFKYIYFPRKRKRVMGDSQYRAGIARNLGAKNAVGEILAFLDSDIVVGPDYLEKVSKGLEKWDALQAKRINLSQDASNLKFEYSKLSRNRDLIPDDPYWEEFRKTKDWHKVPYNWKYVCTHSFSLRKEVFWEVGGLKRNFIFYGFEDTDLGYRLVKNGYKLHLLDTEVLHMFHEDVRSEFMNLKSMRHTLLSRTAQIFYLHHFDEDIYENLLVFMDPEPTFRRFFARVAKPALSSSYGNGKRRFFLQSNKDLEGTHHLSFNGRSI